MKISAGECIFQKNLEKVRAGRTGEEKKSCSIRFPLAFYIILLQKITS